MKTKNFFNANKIVPVVIAVFLLASCNSKKVEEAATDTTPAKEIDFKLFFKNPEKVGFRISGDGKYFSYRADFKGKTNIFVQEAIEGAKPIRVTNDTLRSISGYFWKGDRIIYQQDVGGDENFQIFSVKPDGSGAECLTPFPGVRSEIIDDLKFIKGHEDELMVVINKRDKQYFDPYMLNIKTGKLTLLFDNKLNYDSWYTDNDGVIRLATKTDGVNITYNYRNNEKEAFKELLTVSFKESFSPAGFDASNKVMYVLTNINRDKISLVEYDPIAKKELKEIFTNKDYDLAGIDYDRQKNTLVSVAWEGEKEETHFFDAGWKQIQEDLENKFKGYQVRVTAYDDQRTKGIVWTGNDQLPGKYYLYDFPTKNTVEVANQYPWLEEENMAQVKPISYQSRDGLTIHGYLTIPKGSEGKNLPVLVNPHGGPWARDSWGYSPEVQFLANRGYAVLQMNFRGSTGYGKKFWMASFKEWGKKMQDDVTDGVQWLIKEGIADPKRVAIYGGSYGGYTTLAGICFTPDLYACAVDYVGVSNLFTFMKTIPPYWKPYLDQFHEMVGDPQKDSLLLASASPALHTDNIKVPLFIAQGANDPRVNKAESDQIVEGLKKRGISVDYMVKDNEGHGFHNEDNQFDFYGAMEKFFDKHLKGAKPTSN
jgi:dipeptidyl aminopeptidase/acylaminoacyl peptidase